MSSPSSLLPIYEIEQSLLDAVRAQSDGFDLVITDQTMPQMTGQRLVGELRRIRPNIAILMATGYGSNIDKEALKIAGILLKPVLFDQLAIAVRMALHASVR